MLAAVRELAPLRHPAQERPARPGPGRCKSKVHDSDHFGYAGRRVLASRKWSGKTLDDRRADRKEWLLKARQRANPPGSDAPVRKEAVRDKLRALRSARDRGIDLLAPSLTVGQWLDAWLAEIKCFDGTRPGR